MVEQPEHQYDVERPGLDRIQRMDVALAEFEVFQPVDRGDQAAVRHVRFTRVDALHAAEARARQVQRAQIAALTAEAVVQAVLQHPPARFVDRLDIESVVGRRGAAVGQFVCVEPLPRVDLFDQ